MTNNNLPDGNVVIDTTEDVDSVTVRLMLGPKPGDEDGKCNQWTNKLFKIINFIICYLSVATISIQDDVANNFRIKFRHEDNKINAQISNTISNAYDSGIYQNLAAGVGFDKPIEVSWVNTLFNLCDIGILIYLPFFRFTSSLSQMVSMFTSMRISWINSMLSWITEFHLKSPSWSGLLTIF